MYVIPQISALEKLMYDVFSMLYTEGVWVAMLLKRKKKPDGSFWQEFNTEYFKMLGKFT